MKFIPKTNTQRGALGNHSNWEVVDRRDTKMLIECTCHTNHANRDLRWIESSQAILDEITEVDTWEPDYGDMPE